MAPRAQALAGIMKTEGVEVALLVPVWPACTRAVGGLAHYLEESGIATTQISLIREHTERMRPPRALWVPFELGRPLGAPEHAAFQHRVLRAVLELLQRPAGPILEDFPDDAPSGPEPEVPLTCPVSFATDPSTLSDAEALLHAFQAEVEGLRNWYDEQFCSCPAQHEQNCCAQAGSDRLQ